MRQVTCCLSRVDLRESVEQCQGFTTCEFLALARMPRESMLVLQCAILSHRRPYIVINMIPGGNIKDIVVTYLRHAEPSSKTPVCT
jgi:hypothetical protein